MGLIVAAASHAVPPVPEGLLGVVELVVGLVRVVVGQAWVDVVGQTGYPHGKEAQVVEDGEWQCDVPELEDEALVAIVHVVVGTHVCVGEGVVAVGGSVGRAVAVVGVVKRNWSILRYVVLARTPQLRIKSWPSR